MIVTRFALILALLPLTGCALFPSKETRALLKTPEYRTGYIDGCASAGGPDANPRADTQVRDPQLYASNKAYHAGWGAGVGACRPYTARSTMPPNAGPIPDVNPGARGF